MPRTKAMPKAAPATWAPEAAWQQAELREVNEAVDRLVLDADAGRKTKPPRPPPDAVNLRRILVGIDGSDAGDQAVGWAIGLAKAFGARVWVVSVLAPGSSFDRYARQAGWKVPKEEMQRLDEENGRRILDASVRELHGAQVPAEGILVRGFPAIEIGRAADKHGVDLVILGSHGHGGKERVLLGSVADGVKNSTRANVLIVKDEYRPGEILAPIDGSSPSRLAAYLALRLAKRWKTRATLLHVFEVPWLGYEDWGRDEFQRLIDRFELPTQPRHVRYRLAFGRPGPAILERAQADGAALVVMGSRGLGGLRSLVGGSVSTRVSHEAKTSVLLVKKGPR